MPRLVTARSTLWIDLAAADGELDVLYLEQVLRAVAWLRYSHGLSAEEDQRSLAKLNCQNFGKGFQLWCFTVSERHPYPYPSEAPLSPMS